MGNSAISDYTAKEPEKIPSLQDEIWASMSMDGKKLCAYQSEKLFTRYKQSQREARQRHRECPSKFPDAVCRMTAQRGSENMRIVGKYKGKITVVTFPASPRIFVLCEGRNPLYMDNEALLRQWHFTPSLWNTHMLEMDIYLDLDPVNNIHCIRSLDIVSNPALPVNLAPLPQ